MRGAKTLRAKLEPFKEQALLSKELATVCYTAPITVSADSLRRHQAEMSSLLEMGHVMGGRGEGLFHRLAHSARTI